MSPRSLALAAGAPAFLAAAIALADDGSSSSRGVWWENGLGCQHCGALPWSDEGAEHKRLSYDEATGRSLLNYPPHRFVDYVHMKLELAIADMNRPVMGARETLTLKAIASPAPSITLSVGPTESMVVSSVMLTRAGGAAAAVPFTHDGESLTLDFQPPLAPDESVSLVIDYTLSNPHDGITWTPESAAQPGRPAQLHSQGQPESNHAWFPCHDFPNERLTTEVIATVPAGFSVVSNGRLLDTTTGAPKDSMTPGGPAAAPAFEEGAYRTFHWLQDKPHVNYLVTFVVGKFDVVDIGTSRLPMPVYAPVGRGRDVKRTYGNTPRMISLFERLVDEPFPWDKYAQVVVWNFGAGGMENTSATTMYDSAILDEKALLDGDLDGLISHELAHQWFGDLLTCNSWEHLWLNEGFATYFSHLWFEERDGEDAYLSGVWGSMNGLLDSDKADAPYQPAMCSKEYSHPWEAFRRAANPYPKGASILHMLRRKVGDKAFFEGLKQYVDRRKFQTTETQDLRYALEDVSGLSLDRFFRQWCDRPGVPQVDVNFEWDSSSSSLKVGLTQTQNIDGANPAFFFTLPIYVKLPDGSTRTLEAPMDGKTASASFELPAQPSLVAVDPDLFVLAKFSTNQSWSEQRDLLLSGPTIAVKLRAAAALGAGGFGNLPSEAVTALNAVAHDSRAHVSLRNAAIDALGRVGTPDLLLAAASSPPDDARVRLAVVNQLAGLHEKLAASAPGDAQRISGILASLARNDPSYAVRAAAVRAVAKVGAPDARRIVLDSLSVESQHDQIRQAAIDSLHLFPDRASFDAAVRFTGESTSSRTRPNAVSAVRDLAGVDHDAAYAALVPLLDSPQDRTARAAGDALVKLADPRAEAEFQRLAEHGPSAAARDQARQWIERLHAPASN